MRTLLCMVLAAVVLWPASVMAAAGCGACGPGTWRGDCAPFGANTGGQYCFNDATGFCVQFTHPACFIFEVDGGAQEADAPLANPPRVEVVWEAVKGGRIARVYVNGELNHVRWVPDAGKSWGRLKTIYR